MDYLFEDTEGLGNRGFDSPWTAEGPFLCFSSLSTVYSRKSSI